MVAAPTASHVELTAATIHSRGNAIHSIAVRTSSKQRRRQTLLEQPEASAAAQQQVDAVG